MAPIPFPNAGKLWPSPAPRCMCWTLQTLRMPGSLGVKPWPEGGMGQCRSNLCFGVAFASVDLLDVTAAVGMDVV